jgi:hypothetical protein
MFVPDPDFYPSRPRIRDPKTATKERDEKIFVVIPFLKPQISKIENYFIFEKNAEEKNLAQFSKNYKLFTPKILTRLSKMWGWDPGSEIRKKPIPDPGSKGQKSTGSRIRIYYTGTR